MKKDFLKKLAGALAVIQVFGFCLPVYARDTAFSVGVEYRDKYMVDTRQIAKDAAIGFASCGMNSSYNMTPNTRNIKENISSTVLVYSGHAQYDHVGFNYYNGPDSPAAVSTGRDGTRTTEEGTIYSCVGLEDPSNNLHNTKLAVFAGCFTSDGTVSKSRTLPYVAAMSGAKCAIGWQKKVNMSGLEHWMKRFVNGLADNKTVDEAADYADSFKYDSTIRDGVVTRRRAGLGSIRLVQDVYQFGEGDILGGLYEVQEDGSRIEMLVNETSELPEQGDVRATIYDIPKNIDLEYSFITKDNTEMIEYIKEHLNPDFDSKEYRVTYIDNSSDGDGTEGYIAFDYMIDDYWTDVYYMFQVKNGRLEQVWVMGAPVKTKIAEPRNLPTEEEMKQRALAFHDLPIDQYQVVEQTVTKVYDTMSGEAYFAVNTDYKTKYDDYISLFYKYTISQKDPEQLI